MSEEIKEKFNQPINKDEEIHNVKYINGMYKTWFLDYASYVILERAVPHVFDGLKPVQRRILHAMKKLDDGRYNKVANIIGHTMQYHPHGDASIGDALVQLGQKDILIDSQGNWGNIYTGDSSAAPRYIEARLSKFSLDIVFNPKTTKWKSSYDGRNKEPINLPVKFPLLLAQGAEGIAVGLASKILPHNFIELIEASISHLKGDEFEIFPDFLTGGLADVSRYNDGLRGGKVKVRARIKKLNKKTLVITEIPFGKTTSSLIDSILSANDKGKIKIRKIDDNTASDVEILVHLVSNSSPDKMIDALYAFTDCEISISPNSCVIDENIPKFLGVTEMLKISAESTLDLLKLELEIRKSELEDSWHLSSLEKIFIENRIYLDIEKCETWEDIIKTIDIGLEYFKHLFKREVTREDIIRLTEIKIKRISKYNSFKADEYIKSIEEEVKVVIYNLANIVDYTIDYYETILKKYGKGKERKTEIRSFETIVATKVVIANQKLYINKKEGFAGTTLKKDEYIADCSDIDDMIFFRKDGTYMITKVSAKTFVGQNVIHIAIFKKNDERTIYNVVYFDGKKAYSYMKRFAVKGITRDKEYNLTQGNPNSKILYFTANPNGEAETIKIVLKPKARVRKSIWEQDLSQLSIKGRSSMGNVLTKNGIHRITMKEKGISTLGGRKIWYDETIFRLNIEQRGVFLGEFKSDEKILVITKSGLFKLSSYELSNHYPDDVAIIEKYINDKVFSAVFYDGEKKLNYVKRFMIEETEKMLPFINPDKKDKLIEISYDTYPRIEVIFGGKNNDRPSQIIDIKDFIGVKSYKARGKRITTYITKSIKFIEPLITEEKLEVFKQQNDDNKNETSEPVFEINYPDGKQQTLDL